MVSVLGGWGYGAAGVSQKASAKMQYLSLVIQKVCTRSPVG